MKITKLKKLYEEILDIKENINDTYSLFLFTRIFDFFFEMIFFFFLNIVKFQFSYQTKLSPLYETVFVSFMLLLYPLLFFIKFLIFAICGELLSSQGKTTAIIIHKLMSKIPDSPIQQEVGLKMNILTRFVKRYFKRNFFSIS